jgi:hypothetical protein
MGEDPALHLIRAFIDRVQFGTAHGLFQRMALHGPVATWHLHCIQRNRHSSVARKALAG